MEILVSWVESFFLAEQKQPLHIISTFCQLQYFLFSFHSPHLKRNLVFSKLKLISGYHDWSCLKLAGQTKYYIVHLEIAKKISKLYGMISYNKTAPPLSVVYSTSTDICDDDLCIKSQQFLAVNCCCKALHPRCLRESWMHLWIWEFCQSNHKIKEHFSLCPFSMYVPYFFKDYSSPPKSLDRHIIFFFF